MLTLTHVFYKITLRRFASGGEKMMNCICGSNFDNLL